MNCKQTIRQWQVSRLALSGILLVSFVTISGAMWRRAPSVPLERLLKNVQTYISQNPKDAKGYYVLGRLHSLAFAKGTRELNMYSDDAAPLPEFPSYESIMAKREVKTLTPAAQVHLRESIRNYQQATILDEKDARSFLGLGWVLEDGAIYADKVEPFPTAKKPRGKAAYWRDLALAAYRQAYQLSVASDLKREHLGPGANEAISLEAGEGIMRLLKGHTLSASEQKELARIAETKDAIEQKPRAVTPIIFPLDQPTSLAAMLANEKPVRFDLAGDGQPAWWPWVRPKVGILVWNPTHNGRITSGVQLFGSVTWWVSWSNGYEPLALLDDNSDGWLKGRELEGLAVWVDANSNGISEPGEVIPLPSLGVDRIAAQATGRSENTPFNPHGIQLQNGRFLPTYDWTPTEVKSLRHDYCY